MNASPKGFKIGLNDIICVVYLLKHWPEMDEEAAAAQSLLFSQVYFVIVQSQSLKLSDAETVCIVRLAGTGWVNKEL